MTFLQRFCSFSGQFSVYSTYDQFTVLEPANLAGKTISQVFDEVGIFLKYIIVANSL